jgi:Transposase
VAFQQDPDRLSPHLRHQFAPDGFFGQQAHCPARRGVAQDGPGRPRAVLKKSRWCVLKRKANLTSQQKFRLRDLLRYNLQTVRAYLLKEDFHRFWEYNSPTWAGMFLDFWCDETMRSRIEPMKKIARMLRTHRALLLNYFKARKQYSSGVVEGLNNKAKVALSQNLWVDGLWKKALRGKVQGRDFPTALGNPQERRIPTFATAPATAS